MYQYEVAKWRDNLSELWHENIDKATGRNCGFDSQDQYLAFCAAKDWIQDTTSSIIVHRSEGFNQNRYIAFIEFLGVLQAVYVLQDSICHLRYSFTGRNTGIEELLGPAGKEIRNLRNLAVGHPTKQGGMKKKEGSEAPIKRSVTGCIAYSYDHFEISVYSETEKQWWKVERINLGQLLDKYDQEAKHQMKDIYKKLAEQLAVNPHHL